MASDMSWSSEIDDHQWETLDASTSNKSLLTGCNQSMKASNFSNGCTVEELRESLAGPVNNLSALHARKSRSMSKQEQRKRSSDVLEARIAPADDYGHQSKKRTRDAREAQMFDPLTNATFPALTQQQQQQSPESWQNALAMGAAISAGLSIDGIRNHPVFNMEYLGPADADMEQDSY